MKKRRPRETFRHGRVLCPLCGYEMDASTHIGVKEKPSKPVAGDFSVCLRCGEILRFDDDGGLVPAVGFEVFDDLDAKNRRQLLRAQQMIKSLRLLQRAEKLS